MIEYNAHHNCFTWIDYKQLFADLPIPLRNEIIFNIHGGVMSDLQFFKISEDKVLASRIVPLLKPVLC